MRHAQSTLPVPYTAFLSLQELPCFLGYHCPSLPVCNDVTFLNFSAKTLPPWTLESSQIGIALGIVGKVFSMAPWGLTVG